MKIWDLAIRQPVFMTMLLAVLVVLGSVAYVRMPVDLFPDIQVPIVAINTIYPGASPEEVQDQVTVPIEETVSTLPGVVSVTSTSSEGVSFVLIEFAVEVSDVDASRQVLEKINQIRNALPTDALDPLVLRFDPADQPIIVFGVADATGQMSPVELRRKAEEIVQRPLDRIDGVASVDVTGGEVREIQVNLDLNALQSRRIAAQQVIAAIQADNLSIPGGRVTNDGQQLLLRTPGTFRNLAELENTVVAYRGAPVYLRDVGTVEDTYAERNTLSLLNGQDAVVVSIRRQSGTNTTAVADQVKAELAAIDEANPDLNMVITQDTSVFVKASTDDAIMDLLLGALLAGAVVLVFFRNVRNTLITMSGLPVIMFGTLFLMDAFGVTLNMVTLMALALSVGLVIDDAIVVRENIFRWMERGYSAREAASKATAEVVLPVLATSATILAVFLPIAYAEGIIGQIFRDFGLTICFAIIVSTFEALTMAPMLSAYFFGRGENLEREVNEEAGQESAGESWFDRVYGRILDWVLGHRAVSATISVIILVISLASTGFIEVSFLPGLDQGIISIGMEMPSGTALAVTEREARQVESILRRHPEIETVFTTIGGQGTPEQAQFAANLVDGADSRTVIEQLRGPLAGVPGLAFQAQDNAFGGGRDVSIDLISLDGDYQNLIAAADEMAALVAARPELADVEISYETGKPELQVNVDRQRAAQFGLTTAQIGATVRTLVNGQVASTFQGEGAEADIRVQLRESDRSSVENILALNLLAPSGQLIPLGNVARVDQSSGPSEIQRIDRQPTITVGANAADGDIVASQAVATELIATAPLPPGVIAQLGGSASLQDDSLPNMLMALALSVVFIYMVLASQFGSFSQPLLIMISMPLAVVGAILALVLTAKPLDMTAMIGFIMLMGLVTKNSILLVDFANRQRALGKSASEAMRIAGPVRLRPILMTAISLILGMVPVALGLGAGGDFRAPMAIGIIGGMVTSTALTLLIVPVAYSLLVGLQERMARRASGTSATSTPNTEQMLQAGD